MTDKIAALVFVAADVGMDISVAMLAVAAIGMLLIRPMGRRRDADDHPSGAACHA